MGENVKLLFVGSDDDFRKRFIRYMINDCRNVSIFSMNVEKFRTEVRSRRMDPSQFDVILADEELLDGETVAADDICIIILTESECGEGSGEARYRRIWRYQSASAILSGILGACSEYGISIRRSRSNGSFSIVTVTSASGGAGKTSLCLSLARIRRQYTRHNPLVIDMRSLSDHYRFFPEKEKRESVGINELLMDPERCAESPEQYIVRDRYGVAEFAASEEIKSDIISLDREGMACLLKMIENWGLFDMLVFEMDGRIDDASAFLYGESDCILSMTDERRNRDSEVADRWDNMISRYSGNGKIVRISNFSGFDKQDEISFGDDSGSEVSGEQRGVFRIPYDPDSFYRSDGHEEISLLGKYGASVSRLVKEAVKF